MKKLTTNQILIGGGVIALIYILYNKKPKSKDLTGMKGSIPIYTVSDTVSDTVADTVADTERERLEKEKAERLEKELKLKSNSPCDLLKKTYGEDAVVTYYGRIKSKQVVDKKQKITKGWSKNPNYHQPYKDGGCYEDIKYFFPY